ncbi:MAG: DNA mismatch repair endonuclease MutL [Christensenella sp.]|nr:DNA mismatch repair endonuclease MutL [Christensenella sp.]
MPKVHVLPPRIANQIAAGEVVERPSSVVKELVENSIDAGATNVTIEIENGGIDSIRIIDNGGGIADDDCETAFLRHATSKISTANDLFSIRSLGFRGEALASIAAVSRVTLQTQIEGDELGSLIRYEGGELMEHKRVAGTRGTSVEVRNLFFNVPARLKFIKSSRAESAAIGDYVARLILSAPQIAVHYISGGKTVYRSTGNGNAKDALVSVYGVSTERQICPVLFDDGYLKITGFVGVPDLARANRSGQTFLLNGRIIRSNELSNALSRSFDTRVLIGRFPFAVLYLNIAFAEVDVNVHPTKMEVRFTDEQRVSRSVVAACSEALIRSYVPTIEQKSELLEEKLRFEPNVPERDDAPYHPEEKIDLRAPFQRPSGTLRESGYVGLPPRVPTFRMPSRDPEPPANPDPIFLSTPVESFDNPYHIIGCAFDSYWYVQQGENVYCIDQHAAHERLLYDALMTRSAAVVSQTLFLPEDVRLLPSESDVFFTNKEELERFGFVFSDAGETSVTLLAVPQVNGSALKSAFLHDVLEFLSGSDEARPNDWFRDAIAQSACKHAVKAGERLSHDEIKQLLEKIREQDTLLTCPHGRPVAIRFSKTEIEKMFKRIL